MCDVCSGLFIVWGYMLLEGFMGEAICVFVDSKLAPKLHAL